MTEKELLKEIYEFIKDDADVAIKYGFAKETSVIIKEIFEKHNYKAEAPDERDILLQRIKAVVMAAHENRNPAAREQCAEVILKLFLESSYQPENVNV